jgi:hypothetical protein
MREGEYYLGKYRDDGEINQRQTLVSLDVTPSYTHERYGYRVDALVPEQPTMSNEARHVFLAPVRVEMHNGHLASFLRQLDRMAKPDNQKVGCILFVNETADDTRRGGAVHNENRLMVQYLGALVARDVDTINQLGVPEEYVALAEELIEHDTVDLRFDYLELDESYPHMGKLRGHLVNLAKQYKPEGRSEDQVIIHGGDVDTRYSPNYLRRLDAYYEDESHQANEQTMIICLMFWKVRLTKLMSKR